MKLFRKLLLPCFLFLSMESIGQTNAGIFFKGALKSIRDKEYSDLLATVDSNLRLPLADSTEYNWQDAFYAIELTNYKPNWLRQKIKMAFDSISKRNDLFKKKLLELLYAQKITGFNAQVHELILHTKDAKTFAIGAEYLMIFDTHPIVIPNIEWLAKQKFFPAKDKKTEVIISCLLQRTKEHASNKTNFAIDKNLFAKNYLEGKTIVYSIQRKNRDFPGIVIVRDTGGNFVTDEKGKIFFVPQLARSISNLPYYITNGNTPQGFYRMFNFGVSSMTDIGPSKNIQLSMPFETSIKHFFIDSISQDSAWTPDVYKKLLPQSNKNYTALYQTYYASEAGRTEIIAHGTTVNPDYYKGLSFYPHTPTFGCLCTKESWSEYNGERLFSNQQKLVDAIDKAGGPNGYLIMLEINDLQKPVSINEVLPFLN